MDVGRLSAETYRFIEEHVLPDLAWPTFNGVLHEFKKKGESPPFVYIDVLPALAYQAAGGDPHQAIPLAAAWILNLIAGRIFDDQQDEEGAESPWMGNGVAGASSFGLFALGAANAALSHLQVSSQTLSEIMRAFGNVLSLSAKGQRTVLDLNGITVERYFSHIVAKTGIVFATGAWAGGRMAASDIADDTADALYHFGMNLGIAIQIADDCQDIGAADLHRHHHTLPVIYALSQNDHHAHPSLVSLLENQSNEQWVGEVMHKLREMSAIDWSLRLATVYRARALSALEVLPQYNLAPLIAFARGHYDVVY